MKYIYQIIILLLFSQAAFAEFTIHVLNPWLDDTSSARRDSLRMVGNAEVNYHPGSAMISEGGGWFLYNYVKEPRDGKTAFKITTWIGPETYKGRVTYGRTMRIDSLFALVPVNSEDIWVVLNPDTTKFPAVYATPPKGKVVYLLNPWPENSPKISINNQSAIQMRLRDDLCGWYRYFFAGPSDSLTNVTFTDYYSTQIYTASGMTRGPGIDLHKVLKNYDTVYVLPRPFPAGAPALSSYFPGRLGDCNTRKVSGIFRDWKQDNVSFFNQPMGSSSGHKGMVRPTLTAPDWKPKLTDNPSVNVTSATKLDTWFKTITFPDGKGNDTCIDLVMTKGYDGRWTFDSDNTGGFFPVDDFNNPNNIKYLNRLNANDKTGTMHNFHFTMEMHMQFIYREGIGLEFNFRGDDDVWIYVNNRLAIDLGGLNYLAKDTLYLDKRKNDLQLVDGQIYNMDIFFAERNPIGSNFLIRTSMDLRNSGELYYKEKQTGSGVYQYDIWQQVESEANDCGLTRLTDGEELSKVNFLIEGPQFTSATDIPAGVHYKGITVDPSGSRVTIDSAKVDGLLPGDYRITFISTFNKDRSGYLTFHIAPKPDHLDLMPDTILLDLKNDVVIDSIIMGEEKDSLLLYSVIRDIYGTYIQDGTNLTWKSSNENALTITPSGTDNAKAMIKKVDGGSAWVIVSQEGLKPDSVRIHAIEKPSWPLIASAKMADSRGDLTPDVVYITLSDTFKIGQTLTSVEISYRNKIYSIAAGDCQIEGINLGVPFITSTGTDSRPVGTATIFIDVTGKERKHTGTITDGVAPALRTVEIIEKGDGDPDVLYITFSEPVFPTTLFGNQYLLVKNGTVDTLRLSTSAVSEIIKDSLYSMIVTPMGTMPVPGDKLRLLPASKGGNVSDINDNRPHDLNPSVVIEFRKGAATILSTWYKDTDADGVLDSLMIHFKRDIDTDEFDTLVVQWNQKLFKVDPSKIVKRQDSIITLPLRGTVVSSTTIATSGAMYIIVNYVNVPSVTRSHAVSDSAAPVLLDAKLYLGSLFENDIKEPDTLRVTFSEAVKSTNEMPFFLESKETADRYTFQTISFDVSGTRCEFLINSGFTASSIVPSTGDSIWINEQAGVVDVFGAVQNNKANHRTVLEVIQPPVEWILKAGPNPITPENPAITITGKTRTVVDLSQYTARIIIFDGVGNAIVNSPMIKEDRSFSFNWKGTNSNGRSVGNGTYVAVVAIYADNVIVWSERIKIGVHGGRRF